MWSFNFEKRGEIFSMNIKGSTPFVIFTKLYSTFDLILRCHQEFVSFKHWISRLAMFRVDKQTSKLIRFNS